MDHDQADGVLTPRVRSLRSEWGAGIRRRRKARGWSIERLARMTTFTMSTLSNAERGINFPNEELKFQLAEIFRTNVGDLFPYPPTVGTERIAS